MDKQLFEYLPEVLREDSGTRDFLQAFEKILLGRMDGKINPDGLEHIIGHLARYFDPDHDHAPAEFLPWLASWLAFSLRADLPPHKHRRFIQTLSQRYRYRGTKKSLTELFTVFTDRKPTIMEPDDQPHHFRVMVDFSDLIVGGEQQQERLDRLLEIAHALIEREKPAHTYFTLIPLFPSFRVGRLDGRRTKYRGLDAQVGGIDAQGNVVGNTRLGTAYWEK